MSIALSYCNPAIVISCNKLSKLCVHCPLAKSHKLPFSLFSSHASHPLELLHLDLLDPAPCPATSGARYVLLIIGDFSRYTWLYFLSTKDQALPSFINFQKLVERQLNTSIKHLQYDNGGEFLAFKSYLQSQGISHQFSRPHTPEQNGRAERKIRHLLETGLALSAQTSLPLKYWMQSFQTAAYLINLLPTKVLSYQSPIQLLFHKAPNYTHLHIFGCLCFPSLKPYMTNKLSYRSTPCVFLGYAPSHKGNLCLDTKTDRFYISRHVIFHENTFPFQSSLVSSDTSSSSDVELVFTPALLPQPQHSSSNSSSLCPSPSTAPLPPLLPVPFTQSDTSSSIPSPPPSNTHPMITRAKFGIYTKKAYLASQITEPRTYAQASKHPVWIEAMNTEYQALLRNQTWTLVSPPLGAHIVGCRWIYKVKYKQDGSVDRFKQKGLSYPARRSTRPC